MPPYYTPTKADWKLFQQLVPGWQEKYMAHLCEEYAAILLGEDKGSEAFWEIEKRIRQDRKSPGVMIHMSKSEMEWHIIGLLRDEVIVFNDLSDFSEELKERVKYIAEASSD